MCVRLKLSVSFVLTFTHILKIITGTKFLHQIEIHFVWI